MPRYDRDDYSACDWRATKSDYRRSQYKPRPFMSALTVVKWMIASVIAIGAFASFFHWLQGMGVIL